LERAGWVIIKIGGAVILALRRNQLESGWNRVTVVGNTVLVRYRADAEDGLTVLELLLVVAIIGTLAMIAVPNYLKALHKARVGGVIEDLRQIEDKIAIYLIENGELPDSLSQVMQPVPKDEWGNPYQYLRIQGGNIKGKGKMRKDRFLVPLNSDYDLYSMGPDGKSRPPLTAAHSRDDIIRAGDGTYLGVASEY
jgi:general secretion pathway protein G